MLRPPLTETPRKYPFFSIFSLLLCLGSLFVDLALAFRWPCVPTSRKKKTNKKNCIMTVRLPKIWSAFLILILCLEVIQCMSSDSVPAANSGVPVVQISSSPLVQLGSNPELKGLTESRPSTHKLSPCLQTDLDWLKPGQRLTFSRQGWTDRRGVPNRKELECVSGQCGNLGSSVTCQSVGYSRETKPNYSQSNDLQSNDSQTNPLWECSEEGNRLEIVNAHMQCQDAAVTRSKNCKRPKSCSLDVVVGRRILAPSFFSRLVRFFFDTFVPVVSQMGLFAGSLAFFILLFQAVFYHLVSKPVSTPVSLSAQSESTSSSLTTRSFALPSVPSFPPKDSPPFSHPEPAPEPKLSKKPSPDEPRTPRRKERKPCSTPGHTPRHAQPAKVKDLLPEKVNNRVKDALTENKLKDARAAKLKHASARSSRQERPRV